ncbi:MULTISPECIES: type IV secretion system protein [Acidithiobacillaceae]|uniref:Type IV secretion system protein n=2 Tax=Acidithiobacillaceae TaxID=225058 RepID=A0AAE2YNQ2_9PROT|nr:MULTISPECIES: type IV secretion system protein [Acidithiobacillaceae]MBU2763400.1 type IV secretion system protein [Acidithiobacillus caldus]MBU2771239.1 type IV secretion system protein [Acidithiobacillus caldus]MBU2787213.1 type IV secretion system protein [Igneacidithiobacillus copahuensis]MBU2797532.1 type IV secretion system protein [Acidithiobacillus sp. VAN18-2]
MAEKPDYLAARREWLERYGDYIAQAKNWRMMAFGAIAIAALFGAGMVYEADRVHVVPYVVEVDKLGKSVELAQAVKAGAFAQPVVQHVISRFVWLLFTQSPDLNLQKHFVHESYDYIASVDESALDAFYQRHNPYSAYANKTQGHTVLINSAEPVGKVTPQGGSYIVDFQVKEYGPHGRLDAIKNWQGTITYATVPPSDNPNVLEGNPFGIYITHFAFSRQIG